MSGTDYTVEHFHSSRAFIHHFPSTLIQSFVIFYFLFSKMPHSTGNSVYVVTGGNRGIGLGLVAALIARTSTTVVCTVRNSEAAAAVRSQITTLGKGSSLYIVQLDFSNAVTVERIREAFTAATSNASIDHVDVLMCNAGPPRPSC